MRDSDVISVRVENGISVIRICSAKRIFFDLETGDALFEALSDSADDDSVRAVVVTGGAPGYFARHYSVQALIDLGEKLKGSDWPENARYRPGSFEKAMTLVESMGKPVIAAIGGTAMGGAFEFCLACDIRIAQEGPFQIGFPEINLGILPGAGGTQRLPRTIGMPGALMHILMGVTIPPPEAAAKGFVHECVRGSALDRAMEIARHIAKHTPESVGYIKRLVRGAVGTPLEDGLALERNLFMKLCIGEDALARMKAYEAKGITDPSQPVA